MFIYSQVGRSRPPPKTSTSARRGRRKKGSDSESEDEEEYIPRPSKRRGAAANRKSLKEQSDSGKMNYSSSCFNGQIIFVM